MTGRPRTAGLVLAGGHASRFGSDKLQAVYRGRPLVHRPIDALAGLCEEVVLVVGSEQAPPLPPELRRLVRVVRDQEPDAGPLAALVAGLDATSAEVALVVAGDMPTLVPALLRDLLARLEDPSAAAAVLLDGDRLRPLPAAVRRAPTLEAARALRAARSGRLRDVFAGVHTVTVPEPEWRLLDPTAASLEDVDTPDDLARLEAQAGG